MELKIYQQLVRELNQELAQEKASKVEFFVRLQEAKKELEELKSKEEQTDGLEDNE